MGDEYVPNGSAGFYSELWETKRKNPIRSLVGFASPEDVPRRIGICGAFDTNKNQIAIYLGKKLRLPVIQRVPRTVREIGLPINKNGTLESSFAMWTAQLNEQVDIVEFVSDNTLLTYAAYANWIAGHSNSEADSRLATALTNLTYCIFNEQYSVIFYTPIIRQIKPNGIRSRDKKFQREIDEIILEFLDAFDTDYIPLTGSLRDQSATAMDALDDWGLVR